MKSSGDFYKNLFRCSPYDLLAGFPFVIPLEVFVGILSNFFTEIHLELFPVISLIILLSISFGIFAGILSEILPGVHTRISPEIMRFL